MSSRYEGGSRMFKNYDASVFLFTPSSWFFTDVVDGMI